ncbi:membrane protein insertion efficiency factor YidD [bacterium]|nr:membrane protein insertion efficiency factor YidD [bacterium]
MSNLARKFLCGIIKVYQNSIGLVLPKVCRFEPTCSVYSYQAIQKYGVFHGLFLSIKRIIRCNPFCRGGYDPVP